MEGKKILFWSSLALMVMTVVSFVYSIVTLDASLSSALDQYAAQIAQTGIDFKKVTLIMLIVFFVIRFALILVGFLAKGKAPVFMIVLGALFVLGSIPSFKAGIAAGIISIVTFVAAIAFLFGAIKNKKEKDDE